MARHHHRNHFLLLRNVSQERIAEKWANSWAIPRPAKGLGETCCQRRFQSTRSNRRRRLRAGQESDSLR